MTRNCNRADVAQNYTVFMMFFILISDPYNSLEALVVRCRYNGISKFLIRFNCRLETGEMELVGGYKCTSPSHL